jgi:hypothetical protein
VSCYNFSLLTTENSHKLDRLNLEILVKNTPVDPMGAVGFPYRPHFAEVLAFTNFYPSSTPGHHQIMKIQLLGLTVATALTFAPTVQAQVVSSIKILPVINIQSNIAIGKNNFSQGTPQVSNLNIVQVAPISTPTTISIATPISLIGSHHGANIPAAYTFTMPTVVSNIIIAPVTQIQSNIAIGSTNGVQGGPQIANTGTYQAAALSGSSNNGSSISNYAYTPITQYQSNFAADSYNLNQGGGSISNGTNIQTGTISR